MKKSKYTRKVLSFVLGSISIIFVLVFVISTIAFGIAYNAFKENNIESALSKLEMLSVTGESTFNEALSIASNIALESYVDEYKTIPDPLAPDKVFGTYKLINSLQAYSVTFRYAEECVVFFEISESIVFNKYFRYMDDYYESFYSEVYDTYEEFREHIFNDNADYYELRSEESNIGKEVNTYVTLKDREDEVFSVVRIRITTDDIYNQMNSLLAYEEDNEYPIGYVAITDTDKQILMSVGDEALADHLNDSQYKEFTLEGIKYVSVSVTDNNGFRYTNILPNSIFTRQLKYMTLTFAIIFLFIAIVIIAIGFILMKRHAKSLNHIMHMLDTPGKSESLYQKIDTKIQDLIEDNTLLTNHLKEEKAVLLDMFYEKLLKGSYMNEKDLQNNMEITGTNINGSLYSVGLFCAREDMSDTAIDSITARNLSIKYAVSDIIINELFAHVVLCDQLVTVVFVANTSQEVFERNLDLFIEKFQLNMKNYNYDHYLCLGGITEDIMLVQKSYNLALLMNMKHKADKDSGAVYKVSSGDIPMDEIVEINDTLKNRIYTLVTKGDTKEVETLLTEIMNGIIKEAKSKSSITVHIYILWELLIKVIKDNHLNGDSGSSKYIKHYMNLDIYSSREQIKLVSEGFVAMTAYFNTMNVSRNNTFFNSILDFINTEFTNPHLSLVYIADRFGISVTKLSKHFKENNIEYSSYIMNLRMNLAKHVLINSDTSIKSIANQVGYTSSNSFCRAFKRLEGISANEYRSNHN